MDAFGLNENLNYSMSRFLCFREIKRLFRIVESILIFILVTWAANRLPFVVRISGEYFRRLLSVIVSPLFIFLLGNFIALTLYFKSRNLFLPQDELEAVHLDLVEINGPYELTGEIDSDIRQPEEIVYEDKQTILEGSKVVKVHKRSQSENFSKTEKSVLEVKQLRRSETEMLRRVAAEDVEVVDGMSNEEFQRAIEEFIAKQIKFHQEEKLAIVVPAST